VLNEIAVRAGLEKGLGYAGMEGRAVFSFPVFVGRLHEVGIGCRTNSKSWTKGQNFRDFRDLFYCTFLTKDFPEIGYILSTLSKTRFASGQPGQPDGHFRDLFSCTIFMKDFPEIGSNVLSII